MLTSSLLLYGSYPRRCLCKMQQSSAAIRSQHSPRSRHCRLLDQFTADEEGSCNTVNNAKSTIRARPGSRSTSFALPNNEVLSTEFCNPARQSVCLEIV
jgi:hypothetical protein